MIPKISTRLAALLITVSLLALAAARILGSSDIYDKEQPRTTSYTADMLLNHHWALPTDNSGLPATKPPLYNWLSLPLVLATGYNEFALKFPSLLSAALVALQIYYFTKWLLRRGTGVPPVFPHTKPNPDSPYTPVSPNDQLLITNDQLPLLTPSQIHSTSLLAALLWLASFSTFRLMYLARPDMLLIACLTAAWSSATIILLEPNPHRRRYAPLALWLSTALAALAKGPMALVPIAYLFLASKLLTTRFSTARRAGSLWGIPLVLLIFAAWALPAYLNNPAHFQNILLGKEIAGRTAGPLETLLSSWRVPHYSIAPFLPWSLLALLSLYFIGRRWRTHPLAPAIIWSFLIPLSLSLFFSKRADRFAPMFPAVAPLAAYALTTLTAKWTRPHPAEPPIGTASVSESAGPPTTTPQAPSLKPQASTLIAILISLTSAAVCIVHIFFAQESKTHTGDRLKTFAQQASRIIGRDPIIFQNTPYSPLPTLMARHQDGPPTPTQIAQAKWIIKKYNNEPTAILISQTITDAEGTTTSPPPGHLALYPFTPLTSQPNK